MYYTIVKTFGPKFDNDAWQRYLEFSKLTQISNFCSLDGILCPSLFAPKSDDDWENCFKEDCKTHLLTNLDYAKNK
ncbi:MAG TPA: hypothetical protein PKY81_09395 [bacterium]|nr:hypothetical protein [bacterium]HPN31159.1 hypothetical protein [bacterium]